MKDPIKFRQMQEARRLLLLIGIISAIWFGILLTLVSLHIKGN
jgi:hypothetical protein